MPTAHTPGETLKAVSGSQRRALKREGGKEVAKVAAATPPAPSQLEQIGACFRWQVWPWWVSLLAAIYLLTKQHLLYESPCAVLATASPVTRGEISRAYRSISMCTHPDRLVGSPENQARGALLFKRVTAARDALLERVRANAVELEAAGLGGADGPQPAASCMSSELEVYLYRLVGEIAGELGSLRAAEVAAAARSFVVALVTFEAGITHTISTCLLLLMLYRMLAAIAGALTSAPPALLLARACSSALLGPVPTVCRLLLAPLLRIAVFAQRLARGEADEAAASAPGAEGERAPPPPPPPVGAAAAMPAERAGLPRNARRRAGGERRVGAAEVERREQEALLGRGANAQPEGAQDEAISDQLAEGGLSAMPSALHDIIRQRGPGGMISASTARIKAAEIVQFDMLLALTKPIFPLLTLLATGQAYNGLVFVLITTKLLRKVPFLGLEGLHLACALCGLLHTILGVSAGAISSHQRGLLHLEWHWSFKDVAMIAHVALTGATYASLSRLGNEPLLVASFASGVAARILLLEQLPPSWLPDLNPRLAHVHVQFARIDDVGVRSRGGVGSCAGGLFRWVAGERHGSLLALVTKGVLLLLPLLAAAQWLARSERNARRLHRRGARRRCGGSLALALLALGQAGLLLSFDLNSINGPLPNLWIACLLGALFESLLSTYNVLGRMRSFLGWILYVLL